MYLGRRPDKIIFVYINARLMKNQTRMGCELNDISHVIKIFII